MSPTKLKSRINKLEEQISLKYNDPCQIEDARARKIDWRPIYSGGHSGLVLYDLEFNANSLTIQPSKVFKNLYRILLSVGVIIPLLAFKKINPSLDMDFLLSEHCVFFTVSFVPLIIGLFLFKNSKKIITLNKHRGVTWNGSNFIPWDEILAIQILKKKLDKKRFTYELNIVLTDLNRRHLINVGSARDIKNKAETIGNYLNIPVWNGIKFSE